MSRATADWLGYVLKQTAHALGRRMEVATGAAGLSLPQFAALATLAERQGLSNADLARAAFVTAQSMQGVLAGLEAAGLVERRADPDHGRRRPAAITAAGRARLAQAEIRVAAVEAALEAAAGEIDGTTQSLRRMRDAMARPPEKQGEEAGQDG